MRHIPANNKYYFTRTDYVKDLICEKTLTKSAISRKANVTPQAVNEIYNDMVKKKEINDYYKELKRTKKLKNF